MNLRVELTPAQEAEFEALVTNYAENPPKGKIVAQCSGGCGRHIPAGYLFVVTKWKTVDWGTVMQSLPTSQPAEIVCRSCARYIQGPGRGHRSRVEAPVVDNGGSVEVLSVKEVAVRLLTVLNDCEKPHSTAWLAKTAEVPDDGVPGAVLKKLYEAGKILRNEEGRWLRKER